MILNKRSITTHLVDILEIKSISHYHLVLSTRTLTIALMNQPPGTGESGIKNWYTKYTHFYLFHSIHSYQPEATHLILVYLNQFGWVSRVVPDKASEATEFKWH